ncbi:S28 family serine protease [Lentzea sp. BCCO 10_0856]|uniref:S28 family serine protease n=1 Tax=Lentzea miocenica TaxID=3095431 RepID=A0ABU4SVE5_9PSEU|nr:S28 family serine protease [Lentzea sp. BCCO 10_0856]MDX8029881.1 S28 family serine protease [Lentzea sp. BCCO 10_0856]
MNRLVRSLLAFGLASAQVLAVASVVSAAPDIKDRIAALPGVRIISEGMSGTARTFVLGIQQPADHHRPRGSRFEQRFSLLHKDDAKPMVLHTTGYGLPGTIGASEPARLVDGNQLSVEQRFFTPSRPVPADWDDLNIWQAANDHHRIVLAFKKIYRARWLSTGASKGGMTSIYHRRFFPRDVDATIAYVAPNDVVNDRDVYGEFIRNVGNDPTCNKRLEGVQRQILQHRDEIVSRLEAKGYTYKQFGSAHRALEILVLDTPFTFWQYGTQEQCALVPGASASVDDLWTFMDKTVGWDFYTDAGVAPYAPYYYQAGTQLGWPEADESAVRDLLRYPGVSVPRSMVSPEIRFPRFDRSAMRDVDSWVRYQGSRLLFVNGQNDPWSAEPFRLGPGTRDSLSFAVPGGNHGANIAKLPEKERAAATAAVQRWAGVSEAVSSLAVSDDPDSLDALRARRG